MNDHTINYEPSQQHMPIVDAIKEAIDLANQTKRTVVFNSLGYNFAIAPNSSFNDVFNAYDDYANELAEKDGQRFTTTVNLFDK